MTNALTILRWVLFIPIASLAAALASVVFIGASRYTLGRYEADFSGLFTTLMAGVVVGVVFVAVGGWLAPSKKQWVGWLLAGLTACFFGMVLLPAINAGRFLDLASTALATIAAFVTALQLSKTPQHPAEGRPPGRAIRQQDGSWARVRSTHTGTMHRVDLEPIEQHDGQWRPASKNDTRPSAPMIDQDSPSAGPLKTSPQSSSPPASL